MAPATARPGGSPLRLVPLFLALVLVAPLVPLAALAVDPEEVGLQTAATALLPLGKVRVVVSPTSAMPLFTLAAGSFQFELAAEPHGPPQTGAVVPDCQPLTTVACAGARLHPVGGGAAVPLQVAGVAVGPSPTWPDGRHVILLEATGAAGAAIPPGFYHLEAGYVTPDGAAWVETQPRAVQVVASYASHPRIAVIGDPQVGDPRALQDAGESGDPDEFLHAMDKTFRHFPGRWDAWSDVIAEINAWNPDFVLITGDITFGQDAPGKYVSEYETAWAVLQEFTVPTFLSLGNHDGYVQGGIDGFVLWERYFGPTHYARTYGPDVGIVALNTYDWSEMDRMGVSAGVSAWGGQVRADHLAWVEATLSAFRAASPDGLLFTFAHHNPSWVQDEWPGHDGPQNGVPVAEQVIRGGISYGTTDQGWSGEGRLPLRDLLRAHDVTVHFGGHTHRDRVARDDHGHGVAETTQDKLPGMTDADLRLLHYVFRDNTWGAANQTELAATLADWSRGPFYVDTTTAGSGTTQYWGWRAVVLDPHGTGELDVAGFGWTPPSQAWLDANTNNPLLWNVDHAPLGLYSRPVGYTG